MISELGISALDTSKYCTIPKTIRFEGIARVSQVHAFALLHFVNACENCRLSFASVHIPYAAHFCVYRIVYFVLLSPWHSLQAASTNTHTEQTTNKHTKQNRTTKKKKINKNKKEQEKNGESQNRLSEMHGATEQQRSRQRHS